MITNEQVEEAYKNEQEERARLHKESIRVDLCVESMECPECGGELGNIRAPFFGVATKCVGCSKCSFTWSNKWDLY